MISKYLITRGIFFPYFLEFSSLDPNEAEVNLRKKIIDRQLGDQKTRDRLLDESMFRDFLYEDKLSQKKNLIKYSIDSNLSGKKRENERQIINNNQQILDSLNSLPEVIKPSHIRVNIGNEEKSILSSREKENIIHRNIVRSI